MVSEDEIREAARVLAEHASSPVKVVLFGSVARGAPDRHSDLDFLVIQDHVDDSIREAARLRRVLPSLGVAVDVLTISAAEAERRRRWPGNLVKVALAEGRVLAEA